MSGYMTDKICAERHSKLISRKLGCGRDWLPLALKGAPPLCAAVPVRDVRDVVFWTFELWRELSIRHFPSFLVSRVGFKGSVLQC